MFACFDPTITIRPDFSSSRGIRSSFKYCGPKWLTWYDFSKNSGSWVATIKLYFTETVIGIFTWYQACTCAIDQNINPRFIFIGQFFRCRSNWFKTWKIKIKNRNVFTVTFRLKIYLWVCKKVKFTFIWEHKSETDFGEDLVVRKAMMTLQLRFANFLWSFTAYSVIIGSSQTRTNTFWGNQFLNSRG